LIQRKPFSSAEQKVEFVCIDLDIGARGNLFALHNKKKKKMELWQTMEEER